MNMNKILRSTYTQLKIHRLNLKKYKLKNNQVMAWHPYPSCDKDFFTLLLSLRHCLPAPSTLFLSSPARSIRLILLDFELLKPFDEAPCSTNSIKVSNMNMCL